MTIPPTDPGRARAPAPSPEPQTLAAEAATPVSGTRPAPPPSSPAPGASLFLDSAPPEPDPKAETLPPASVSASQSVALAERFHVERPIAKGGMGTVYLAWDHVLRRKVALKVIRPDRENDSRVARFEREARAMARLRHPNCVALYDLGTLDDGAPFYVMELVEGASLADRIQAEGPLAPRAVASIGRKVARALAAAHDVKVIHRDVKPANILLDAQGEAKLADFGIAFVEDASRRLTAPNNPIGTYSYMPPEQTGEDDAKVDERSDLYALGATLYEALTGKTVFHAARTAMEMIDMILRARPTPVRQLRSDVPPALAAIVERCLEKDRDRRFANARELEKALDDFLTGESAARGRGPIVVVGALAIAAGASVGGAVATAVHRRAATQARAATAGRAADARDAAARALEAARAARAEIDRLEERLDVSGDVARWQGELAAAKARERSALDDAAAKAAAALALADDSARSIARETDEARLDLWGPADATARGVVAIDSTPPGARVRFLRFERGRAAMESRLATEATTPVNVTLAPGSWVAVVERPGFVEARLPFVLRARGERKLSARLIALGQLGSFADRFRPVPEDGGVVLLQTRPVTVADWRELEPARDGDGPIRGLSVDQCRRYADWFGREKLGGLRCELPSRALLARAARGADGRPWPWGFDFDPSLPGSAADVSPFGIELLSTEWTSSGSAMGDPRVPPAFRLAIRLR